VYNQELTEIDNRRWQPGVVCRERAVLNLTDLPAGQWQVKVKMVERLPDREQPILLAVKREHIDNDGYATVASIDML
jgi:hypothetical protein